MPGSPADELARSSLVFVGEIEAVREPSGCDKSANVVTMVVREAFEGTEEGRAVRVAFDASACAVTPHVGDTYVVFADDADPFVSTCSPHLRLGSDRAYTYCDDASPGSAEPSVLCPEGQVPVTLSESELLDALRAATANAPAGG